MRLIAFAVVLLVSLGSGRASALAIDNNVSFDGGLPVFDGFVAAKTTKKVPKGLKPDPKRVLPKANPVNAGLAAAGAAGGTALVGGGITALSAMALLGVFGAPSLPVTVTAAVLAIALGVGTPILAGLAGGSALLAMDPRTKPTDWNGLIGCATSGCCSGLSLVGGTALGSVCGSAPALPNGPSTPGVPGIDQPAPWTAAAAIAGLLGGGVVGGLLGWSVAPSPDQPFVPITIGALAGGTLGAAIAAGVGGGIAEAIRK